METINPWNTEHLAAGDEVTHPRFGSGTVRWVAGQWARVEFSDGPHKVLLRSITLAT